MFGEISTGALNDLERATKKAYAMVTYFGMSPEVGNISFFDSTGQNEYSFTKPYSEETAVLIDKETKKIVENSYQRALKILRDNREGHEKLAQRLLEKEVIFSDDLEELFGKRKGKSKEEEKREQREKQAEQTTEKTEKNIENKSEEK